MGSEMTTGNEETSREPSELNEEERASIFASANVRRDRSGAVRRGRVTIPPKFVAWTIVAWTISALQARGFFGICCRAVPIMH